MKNRPLILTFATLLTASCGEIAVNGLRPGEERGTAPADPIFALRGDQEGAVTIRAAQRTLFLDNPTFRGPVTVEPGAQIAGGAVFAATLNVKGTAEKPVNWQLAPGDVVTLNAGTLDWLEIAGGRLDAAPGVGQTVLARDSSFRAMTATLDLGRAARSVFVYCAFTNTTIEATYPPSGAAPQTGLAPWRLFASQLDYSTIRFIGGAPTAQTQEIEFNDFQLLRDGQSYLTFERPEDARLVKTLASKNFFANPGTFTLPAPVSFIGKPYTAGPGILDALASHLANGSKTVSFKVPQWDPPEMYGIYLTTADVIMSDISAAAFSSAIAKELSRFVYALGAPDGVATTSKPSVETALEVTTPCKVMTSDAWPYVLACEGAFNLRLTSTVKISGKPIGEAVAERAFKATSGAPFNRTVSMLVLDAVAKLTETGLLKDVPGVETPYF